MNYWFIFIIRRCPKAQIFKKSTPYYSMSNLIKTAENILNQTNTVVSSYEKVAKATGSNFNIFSILHVGTDEVKTHSRFIAYLLSQKSNHGFDNKFLKNLIDIIDLNIDKFNYDNYSVHTEHHIGSINEDYTKGGQIDILIKDDSENSILIENKIYAEEQKNQLMRYKNAFPNGSLLYLNLWGSESGERSSENLDYTIISYKDDIVNWIDKCQKTSIDNPIIRETLKQYKNLIKKITNQNMDSQLNEELIKIVLQNEDSFNSFLQMRNIDFKKHIVESVIEPIVKDVAEENNLKIETNFFGGWPSFSFINDEMKDKGIGSICFSSSSPKGFNKIVYGFLPLVDENRDMDNEHKIKTKFNGVFDYYRGSGYYNWVSLGLFNDYLSFDDYDVLGNIYFNKDAFKDNLNEKIKKMLEIVESL